MSDDEIRQQYGDTYLAMLRLLQDHFWARRAHYAEHRTREDLDALLHYGHWIPLSKGWTTEFVDQHYPGWTWNQLVRIITAAEIFVNRGGSPPKTDPGVKSFYFDSETGWLVDWADGRVTIGLAEPGTTKPARTGQGLPVLDLSTGEQLESDL